MATDPDNVRVAVTGAIYSGTTDAVAPTGTASDVTAFDDLGLASEDGIVLTMPGAGDTTPIKAWQNGATVRVLRSLSDDLPQIQVTLIETKLEVIETALGVSVTQTTTEGSFEIDTTVPQTAKSFVVDVIDGAELIRSYVPQGVVTAIGEITLANTSAIGYQITIDCERNNTAGYNLKTWMTALKTAA